MTRTTYSSDRLSGNRRTAWQDVIKDVYANLDIDIGRNEQFSATICRRLIGSAELTEVAADSEYARRTSRHIARSVSGAYLYLLVRSGRLSVVQFGRECTIGPGQYTLLHLDQPYLFSHPDRVEKVGFKVPTHFLRLREAQLVAHCAVPRSASTGVARLAASYVDGLCGSDLVPTEIVSHGLARTASDLLCLLFESMETAALPNETPVTAALRRRCEAYIAANSANRELDPERIASAVGISVRYLHQCFELTGTTVMEQVKQQRLARCHSELLHPGLRRLPVAEIAARNGFRNVSHFNEAFKVRYGLTPRQVRALATSS